MRVGFSEAAVSRIAKTPGCSEVSDLRFAWGCKRIRLSEPCTLCWHAILRKFYNTLLHSILRKSFYNTLLQAIQRKLNNTLLHAIQRKFCENILPLDFGLIC